MKGNGIRFFSAVLGFAGLAALATPAIAQNEQFIPMTSYRIGPYAAARSSMSSDVPINSSGRLVGTLVNAVLDSTSLDAEGCRNRTAVVNGRT